MQKNYQSCGITFTQVILGKEAVNFMLLYNM